MKTKGMPLTENQVRVIVGEGGWQPHELGRGEARTLGAWVLGNDAIGMVASGCPMQPAMLHGLSAVAGVDWLRLETKPRPGEPEGNAYHFVVTKEPWGYWMHGPFLDGTVVPHWFEGDDLDLYDPFLG